MNTDDSKFFQINGILMEKIDGFSLNMLYSDPTLLDEGKWQNVLQRVVDTSKDINERGVVLGDCRPGNVLICASSETPFFHDFAQSTTFDPKDRKQLVESVLQNNNFGNLVRRLESCLETKKKAKLGVMYPDIYGPGDEPVGEHEDASEACEVKSARVIAGMNDDLAGAAQGRASGASERMKHEHTAMSGENLK